MNRPETKHHYILRLSALAPKAGLPKLPRRQLNVLGLLTLVLILLFTAATLADMLEELGCVIIGTLFIAEIIILRRK